MAAQFEYSGVDSSGQPIQGLIRGESPIDAVLHLKGAGVTVYSIKKKLLPEDKPFRISRRIRGSDLVSFNEQLASLLKSRLPLADSLRHLSQEIGNPRLKAVLEKITGQLEAGQGLSESLAAQKDYFPPLYMSMVEAGEKSGNLAEVLFEAAGYFKAIEDFRRKFLNILIYPAMLVVLSMAVLVFLIKLMVPPYVHMYSGFRIDLPMPLTILVWVEKFLEPNLFWYGVVPFLLIVLLIFFIAARRSEPVNAFRDRLLLRIPIWGQMAKDAILARSIVTLATLLRSGVPLYESLSLIRDLITNRPLREAFVWVSEQVAEGEPLSQALVKQPLFPLEVATLIRNGEAKGELVESLDHAGRMSRNRLEFSARMLISVLEPALLAVIGVIIISIAVSLFYPLYSLSKYLGT